MKQKIRYFLVLLLTSTLLFFNYQIFSQIEEDGIVIEYMALEKSVDIINPDFYLDRSIECETCSIIQLKNGTFMMPVIKKEYPGYHRNICITTSDNLLNWTEPIKLTNYTFTDTSRIYFLRLKIKWQDDKIIVYYLFRPDIGIKYESYWQCIESNDGIIWNGPKNCSKPKDQLWNNTNKKEDYYSGLILNRNGEYMLVSSKNISPTDALSYDLFLEKSKNGKDWSLPIRISNYGDSSDIIQTMEGDYVVVFINYWSPQFLRFNDSDILDLRGPYKIIENPMVERSMLPYFCRSFFVTIILIGIIIFVLKYKKE